MKRWGRSSLVAVALTALIIGAAATPALAAPVVATVSPATGPNTGAITVTLIGTGMDTVDEAALHKAGQVDIIGTGINHIDAAHVEFDFDLTNAAIGAWDVRATDTSTNPPQSGVCSACFVVTNALPTVDHTNPSSRGQGANGQTIQVIGDNFVSGASVTFGNAGITKTATNFVSQKEIDVTINVSATATTGATTVTVMNPDGGTGSCTCFTVNARPIISAASPNSAANTGPVTLTLTGFNFEQPVGSASLTKTGQTPIPGTNWQWNSANSLSIDFDITSAAPGAWVINVTNPDGAPASCSNCFTVTSASPTVSSASPDHAPQGATALPVTITGDNFARGAAASFSGTGITVNSTTWNDAQHVTANITIAGNAPTGTRTVTVTNTDGNSGTCNPACFTVTLPAPIVTSTTPNKGAQGRTMNVVVNGNNFVNPATVSFTGGAVNGITVNSTTFTDAGHLTVNISISPTATVGSRDVTVTNPDNQSATCSACFSVTLPAPSVSSVSPSSAPQGATKDLTINGSNFVAGATVSFSGTGITINGTPTVVDSSHITLNITIDPDAAATARNVTVTNPDTQSATCTNCFTVKGHEETDATYAWRALSTSKALGGSYTTDHLAGARATYTFTGDSLQWYTVLGPNQGTARVTIDGNSFGTINNYRSTTSFLAAWTFTNLGPGTHTLVIIVNGAKGSRSGTGTFISIDAFRPGGQGLQRTPAVTYGWRIGAFPGASGGHYSMSDVRGSTASFTFTGTAVDWYAVVSANAGRAAIYLDGVSLGDVDLYNPTTETDVVSIDAPQNGTHTLKIYVLGTRSSASHGVLVTIDRFVVG